MVELADIQPNELVLEPSAGQGAIAKFFPKQNPVHLVELNSQNIEVLDRLNQDGVFGCCTLYPGNFLEDERMIYNKIIMNPPFSKQQDIDHVLHAYNTCLKDGGRLVSIMSEGTFFRQNKKAVEFRKLLDEVGYSIELDEGAFKESGTMVRTRIVVMDK
jgi:16S rRNA G1207 methylase RsmC